ncbi:MAG: UDP-N-acetylmuramoyl-tripeptide--D-alanyl-D-alanine ligase [Planctomycetota bacterium]|nr:UDP-N-acetylmuramoyl-tripeptide--D-alanyl-D-alanine ligase [Planctomycetota bacterium]
MKPLTLDEILTAINGRPLSEITPGTVTGVSIDSRTVAAGEIFFAIKGQRFDGHDYVGEALEKGACWAVVSSAERFADAALRAPVISVDDTVAALGRLGAYYRRQIPADVIAVTGSNGKTTTKAMIGHVLSAQKRGCSALKSYNNHIGVPLTLLSSEADDEFLVVEVGTNHAGEIGQLASLIAPDIGVITSVGAVHLEGLKSIDGVIAEKLSLLDRIRRGGLAVVNIDQPRVRDRLRSSSGFTVVSTGTDPHADLRIEQVVSDGASISFSINGRFAVTMPIPGRHNAGNALAAYAVARRLGMSSEDIIRRLATFKLPEMRLQMQRRGNITVINDCYNANPASMQAAMDTIGSMDTPGRRVAIVGDMRELGEHAREHHQELGRLIARSNIDVLLTVGRFADVVCESARRAGSDRLVLHASRSVDDLSSRIGTLLKPTDTVLLKGSRALRLERLIEHIAGH